VPATYASVLTLLEPFVAVVLASAVLGQSVSSLAMAGGVLIVGVGLLVVSAAARPRSTEDRLVSPP
jgi:drug/metabolite transporter (DMT)-like permease